MKRFSRILFYLRSQKRNIFLYLVFNILSILFSLVSLTMLAPFLYMLFGMEKLTTVRPEWSFSSAGIVNYLKYMISQFISQHNEVYALGAICVIIVVSVFFKNLFTICRFGCWLPLTRGHGRWRSRHSFHSACREGSSMKTAEFTAMA